MKFLQIHYTEGKLLSIVCAIVITLLLYSMNHKPKEKENDNWYYHLNDNRHDLD